MVKNSIHQCFLAITGAERRLPRHRCVRATFKGPVLVSVQIKMTKLSFIYNSEWLLRHEGPLGIVVFRAMTCQSFSGPLA